jgi:hypothetical protein
VPCIEPRSASTGGCRAAPCHGATRLDSKGGSEARLDGRPGSACWPACWGPAACRPCTRRRRRPPGTGAGRARTDGPARPAVGARRAGGSCPSPGAASRPRVNVGRRRQARAARSGRAGTRDHAAPASRRPRARRPGPRSDTLCSGPRWRRNWDEFRQQAARRLVQPPRRHLHRPRARALAGDPGARGRAQCRRQRAPRAGAPPPAPGPRHHAAGHRRRAPRRALRLDVSRLPHPWKWAEVFLFDDDRRFKPRTLDK